MSYFADKLMITAHMGGHRGGDNTGGQNWPRVKMVLFAIIQKSVRGKWIKVLLLDIYRDRFILFKFSVAINGFG